MKRTILLTILLAFLVVLASCSGAQPAKESGTATQGQSSATSEAKAGQSNAGSTSEVVTKIAEIFAQGKAVKCTYKMTYQDMQAGTNEMVQVTAYFAKEKKKVETNANGQVNAIIELPDAVYLSGNKANFGTMPGGMENCDWIKVPKEQAPVDESGGEDVQVDERRTLKEVIDEYKTLYHEFNCEVVPVSATLFEPQGNVCDLTQIAQMIGGMNN